MDSETPTQPVYRPREYLSFSTLMDFIRCPRRYFYKKCGIEEKEDAVALVYGTAMHKAVPALLTTWSLDTAIEAFSSAWDTKLDDDKHSRNAAIRSLSNLCWSHARGKGLYTLIEPPKPPPGLVLADKDRSPMELYFAIDVGLRVPICGFIDGWCRHRDSGKLYAWELKTMGRMTASMFSALETDPQLLTYTLVCLTFTDEPIEGVMFEAILKDKSKAENVTHPVTIRQHHLEATQTWLRYWGELLLACEDRWLSEGKKIGTDFEPDLSQAFPQNFAGCTSRPLFWQPGSVCEYMNLCSTPNWRQLLPYYNIKPEHKIIELTKGATS